MKQLHDNNLKKAIGPAKKRIILRHLLKYMVIGVIASLNKRSQTKRPLDSANHQRSLK